MKTLIISFYLCWVFITLLFYSLPIPDDISFFQLRLTFFMFTGGYLLLASCFSYRIIKAVFTESVTSLYIYGVASIALFLMLFWYVSFFDHSPIVVAGISTANLLFGATVLGAALSSAIKRVGELVPVCITAAIADSISVFKGPTKTIVEDITNYYDQGMEGVPPFVDFIIVKAGIPGFEIPVPLFGVTDWILLVLLSSALLRLQMSDNILGSQEKYGNFIYLPVTVLALYAGLVFAQITNSFVPAMVFIGLFFLFYLITKVKVHRELKRVDFAYSLIMPSCVVFLVLIFFP